MNESIEEQNTSVESPERQTGVIDMRLLYVGLIMQAIGLMAPALLSVKSFKIHEILSTAIREQREVYGLWAGLRLIALNTCRAIPHYMGTFLIAESMYKIKYKGWPILSVCIICGVIPLTYTLFDLFYNIHLDFGIPTITMIITLLIFLKVRFDFVNLFKKVLLIALVIASIQFFNIMPVMGDLPFGRGDISYDIKLAAVFLRADSALQTMAMGGCMIALFLGVLLLMLIVEENNIKRLSVQRAKSEQALMRAQIQIMENRTYMELRHLIHDLKSPLTSIQTCVGIVRLLCNEHDDSRELKHLDSIEASIDRMSGMISEILSEKKLTVTTTREIMQGLMAQISASDYVDIVSFENDIPDETVAVNTIRFQRALVNLVENSYYAKSTKIA